jgi:hypothetical protein
MREAIQEKGLFVMFISFLFLARKKKRNRTKEKKNTLFPAGSHQGSAPNPLQHACLSKKKVGWDYHPTVNGFVASNAKQSKRRGERTFCYNALTYVVFSAPSVKNMKFSTNGAVRWRSLGFWGYFSSICHPELVSGSYHRSRLDIYCNFLL